MFLSFTSSIIDLNCLQADCVNLLIKYFKEARHAVCLSSMEEETHGKRDDNTSTQEMEGIPTARTMDLKSKTRGGARCCLCFDPFSIQNLSVIVFFCCHAYHLSCLLGGSDSINIERNVVTNSDDDSDGEGHSGVSRMRCVLCTTASGRA